MLRRNFLRNIIGLALAPLVIILPEKLKAHGGYVSAENTVPAILSPNEYIIRKHTYPYYKPDVVGAVDWLIENTSPKRWECMAKAMDTLKDSYAHPNLHKDLVGAWLPMKSFFMTDEHGMCTCSPFLIRNERDMCITDKRAILNGNNYTTT